MKSKLPKKNEPAYAQRSLFPWLIGFCFNMIIFSDHKHFMLVYNLHHHLKSKEMFLNRKLETPIPPQSFGEQTVPVSYDTTYVCFYYFTGYACMIDDSCSVIFFFVWTLCK